MAQRRKISPQTAFSDWIPTGTDPPAPIWPSKHLKAHFPESRFRADNQGIQSKNAAAGAGCDLGNWRGTWPSATFQGLTTPIRLGERLEGHGWDADGPIEATDRF